MYFIDTVMLCFIFYTIIFRALNDILVKNFNKIQNFSLVCQLEIWNNLGLSVALWDWMYRIRYTCNRFGTVPDPVICPDWQS